MFSNLKLMIKEFILVYIQENWFDITKKILISVVVFISIYILLNIIIKKIETKIQDHEIQYDKYTKRLSHLIGKIIYTVWLVFNILIVCEIMWIDVSLLMAGISLWIWFAMETMIGNIISGFFILTNKKFKIWDFVEILGNINTRGTIEEINLKHTIVRWIDQRRLVIPNSIMSTTTMKTLKSEDLIRWDLNISLPRHVNVDQVKQLITDTTNNYENTEHKEYTNTFIESFDANGYNFHTVYFIDPKKCSAMIAGSAIRKELTKVFKKYGISNPYKHLVAEIN